MGKFVYFTSAEKRQANEVDLPSFLRDRGEKLLQAGREYRLASDHSITVRANRWYDHAARRGGHAISFVRQFYDKTFPEAVTMLLGRDGQGIIPIAKQEPEPQEPKPFALPKPYLTMRRMYAYLTKHRCIDRDVVTAFVQEKLLYATEGSVSVNDRRLGKDLDFPESVGVMIESPAFIDEYTGQKNLELLAGLKQLISASDIHNTLQAVGLDPNDKRTFKKYSLGMKQRLGIAAALMEKPDLLILDEPTNALDEQGVAMIAQLIRKECQCGALVVVACHDADFVQSVSDVVIQIQAGRVTSVIGK